ncbi:MAG TPA: SEC-C metal-binding domain-containing protein [Candidatus Xenobia bacterium]
MAAFAMQFQDGYEDLVLQALQSTDEEILRWGAAAAVRVPEAWDAVVPLATGPDTPKLVRMAAIESVANLRPDEAEALLDPLQEHEDEDVAEAAYEAIGLVRDFVDAGKETMVIPRQVVQQAVSNKVGRNEPCPCGSGKKFKKCCAA